LGNGLGQVVAAAGRAFNRSFPMQAAKFAETLAAITTDKFI
jgi:hypothetical protein